MSEIWKPVAGFDGYEVSSEGRVRSLDRVVTSPQGRQRNRRGNLMKQTVTGGYCLVNLYAETGKKMMRVHRLVAGAFAGGQEPGAVVNHKDGDKLNNSASNLEWTTVQGNTVHSFASGLQEGRKGLKHHNCRLSEDQVREIILKLCAGQSQTQISREYGVSRPEISLINSGVRWDHIRVEGCGSPPYFSRYPTRWSAA